MPSGETATLERYIEASVERLLSGQYSSQNGLILLSSWQEAMPALVHLDPVLEPVDSRVFAVLWIWARQEGRSGTAFPTYDTLLQRCNIQSRRTVARSLAILRITRWVTLCRHVRDPAGRHRGNIYALHDEPLVLPSTLHLDPGYMDFLDTAKTHNHPYVREVARGMWASLEGRIAEGEDVVSTSPVSQTDQRIEALSTLAGEGRGNYFGFLRGALPGLHTWREKQVPNNSPADPVQKVNSVQVHFLNSARCSSSYLNKTTTTTGDENNSAAEPDTQPAEGDLIFPDQLSSSEQRLAEMYLRHFEHDIQQALLDELSEKIRSQAKTHHPVRNPVGLLAWMCKQTRAGEPPLTSALPPRCWQCQHPRIRIRRNIQPDLGHGIYRFLAQYDEPYDLSCVLPCSICDRPHTSKSQYNDFLIYIYCQYPLVVLLRPMAEQSGPAAAGLKL